ncbi:MBL fold metallo-hydrolase [Candidatus Halocynthiibacter alkanivorans]|uniref:MBL fold metallo-hydrolase n=1 Tax=Candidatus Halocynthiibacter alkanivorans TaxID=2267619 RepID=UPI000DF2FD92|nr:MBL fold metallo-hydrolase [Candidatus Halocynthiibacter alkanivorans]
MKNDLMRSLTVAGTVFLSGAGAALAAPCLEVTLTGTQGGPPVFQGQAGSGTLVRYGEEANNCSDVVLQFDAGRGTTQQLSKLKVPVGKLDAIFLTHIHTDHTDGLSELMQLRWHFNSAGPKVDLVCNSDVVAPKGYTMSCARLAASIGDTMIAAGEIAQRLAENPKRLPGGPADLFNVMTFDGAEQIQTVWEQGDVKVTAIASRHIAGHVSFRVDTPAGSVVIGGDAGNDLPKPPRASSTSAQVETLSEGADIVVHSVIHPVMGPDGSSGFPPPIYYRQSTATDLGSMAKRAGVSNLMLTHLIPPIGAAKQGPYPVSDTGLSKQDYIDSVREGGFEGQVIVGTDLATLRLVAP